MDSHSFTETEQLFQTITKKLIETNTSIATMESCTGGLIASLLCDTEGASAVLRGGVVTYTNLIKEHFGVPEQVIRDYGVYSKETAEAMARAAREQFQSDLAIGITGSFSNVDPANPDSVPGSVDYAIAVGEDIHLFHLDLTAEPNRFTYKTVCAAAVGKSLLNLL